MDEEVRVYNFEVETLQAGQKHAYGDSYYEYIITNKSDIDFFDGVVRRFAEFIQPSVRFKDSPCPFDSRETFGKISDRKYRYYQVIPSTH